MMEKVIHGRKIKFQKANDGIHKYIATFIDTETHREKNLKFGAHGMEHYFDRLGRYSNLNHLNDNRKRNYKSRHEKDRHWQGQFTRGFLSDYVLWGKKELL